MATGSSVNEVMSDLSDYTAGIFLSHSACTSNVLVLLPYPEGLEDSKCIHFVNEELADIRTRIKLPKLQICLTACRGIVLHCR